MHHNYLGAMNCARIVAQEMYDSGIKDFINIDYRFEFEDTTGKTITYKINTSLRTSLTLSVADTIFSDGAY